MINSNRKIARVMLMGILLVFTHTSFVYAAEPGNAADPERPSLFNSVKTGLTNVASMIMLRIQSLAIEQAGTIGHEMQTQIRSKVVQCVVDQARGPMIRLTETAPGAIQDTLRYAQQKYYAKTEHHQPLIEALPWAGSSGVCALAAGLLCTLKPEPLIWSYATAGFLGFASLATLYKAITTYRSTIPINADTASTRLICPSPFITHLIQELQLPDQQLALAVESQNSFYLDCQKQNIRQNFVRYLATQSGLPLFIVQAQELIDNPSLVDRYVQRATLAAHAGEHNGALIYIENFELLSNPENQALAGQLSGHISMQTTAAFDKILRLQQIDANDRFRGHEQQDALEAVAQEHDIEKKLHEAQIFFIAGIDRENANIGEPFRSKNQFKTTLELKINDDTSPHDDSVAGAATPADELVSISCGQTSQTLSFVPLANYIKFGNRWDVSAQTFAQDYRAAEERTKKAKHASSSQTLHSIAGGYPREIDTIAHIINNCKDSHKIPSIHGILLYGPAGCGKTYLARSLAGTLSIPFLTVKIADILSNREQASTMLNEYFKDAQKEAEVDNGVAILFIDECDELLRAREHAPEYIAPIAFSLRTILSGFDATYNRVVLIVATNNPPDRLDETLLRSGRFNYKIHIHYPTFKERAAVIAYHATERHLAIDDAFITLLAERTERLSKSDLVMLIDKGTAETDAHDMPLQKALLDELEKIQETQSVRESASQTEDIPALRTWRTFWL